MWRQLTCLNANLDTDLKYGMCIHHFMYVISQNWRTLLESRAISQSLQNFLVWCIRKLTSYENFYHHKKHQSFPLFGSYPITPFRQEKSKTKHKNPFYGWVNELFHSFYSSRRFEISLFIPEAAALHCTGAIVSRAFNLISCHTIYHPHTLNWFS